MSKEVNAGGRFYIFLDSGMTIHPGPFSETQVQRLTLQPCLATVGITLFLWEIVTENIGMGGINHFRYATPGNIV